MLSTKPIKSAGSAKHYFYEKDNYYLKDSNEAELNSNWSGKGADLLNLSGQVVPNQFESLLRGSLPNGTQLGRRVQGEIKHRAGYDLTFSAPKSVSILALVAGDERLLAAHTHAVKRTLDYVERTTAQARQKVGDEMTFQNTHNLIFALFLQDTSRALDPHLHTHCVTMNATQRADGHWRALASNMHDKGEDIQGFWERIRHFQRYFGQVYRSELAYEVKQLGYDIVKREHGLFEIAGVLSSDIHTFSKRRQDIEQFMTERGLEGAKSAAFATLATRPSKESRSRDTLRDNWQSQLTTNVTELVKNAKAHSEKRAVRFARQPGAQEGPIKDVGKEFTANVTLDKEAERTVQLAMEYALQHCEERGQVFHQMLFLQTALSEMALGSADMASVIRAFESLMESGQLLPVATQKSGLMLTTPKLIEKEETLFKEVKELNALRRPTMTRAKLKSYFLQQQHSKATEACLTRLMTSSSNLVALQGRKDALKEQILKPLETLANLDHQPLLVLTHSKLEAKHIATEYGIRHSQTWFKFVNRLEKQLERRPTLKAKHVWVVLADAEHYCIHDWQRLVTLSKKTGFRLLALYDDKAPQTLGHGNAIADMVANGLPCINAPSFTQETLKGAITKTLPTLEHQVVSILEKEKRLDAMVQDWVHLPGNEQLTSRLIAPNKTEAKQLNQLAHEALCREGKLLDKRLTLECLIPRSLTQAELRRARHYRAGHYIQLTRTYSSAKRVRQDFYKVAAVRTEDNTLVVTDSKGKAHKWALEPVLSEVGHAVQVFEVEPKTIHVGETLKAVGAMGKGRLCTQSRWTVYDIQHHTLVLLDDTNRKLKVNTQDIKYRQFDYGYAQTTQQSLVGRLTHVFLHQVSTSPMSSYRHLHKAMMEVGDAIHVYTDDKAEYISELLQHRGEKSGLLARIHQTLNNDASMLNGHTAHGLSETLQTHFHDSVKNMLTTLKAQYPNVVPTELTSPEGLAKEALRYAMAACAEREAGFSHKTLMSIALKHALGDVAAHHVEAAVIEAESSGELLRGTFHSSGTLWTTKTAKAREEAIIAFAKEGVGQCPPLKSAQETEAFLKSTHLNDEQKAVLRLISTNCDRVVNIQGAPGTGKTTLLRATKTLFTALSVSEPYLTSSGLEVQYLAPTHSAVRELSKEALPAQTLQQFLITAEKNDSQASHVQGRLFILDESSFVSTQQVNRFFKLMAACQGRVVLVGDRQQNPAIEAGKPETILTASGVKTLYLKDIRRQTNPKLLSAVKSAHEGRFADSFKLLEQTIVDDGDLIKRLDNQEKPTPEERHGARIKAAVDAYFEREDCLLVTLANDERKELNDVVRARLLEQKQLGDEAIKAMIYEPRHLTEVERSRVSELKVGDVLRFGGAAQPLFGIRGNDYLRVSRLDVKRNQCWLVGDKLSAPIVFQPHEYQEGKQSGYEVYSAEVRELRVGDSIRWTRSNKALRLYGGARFTVSALSTTHAVLTSPNGVTTTLAFNDNAYKHWEHAYATTVHFSQGKTSQNVVGLLESYYKHLANQPNFMVLISRARERAVIITDDKAKLLKNVLENSGEKTSALEILGALSMGNSASASQAAPSNSDEKACVKTAQTTPYERTFERQSYWNVQQLSERLNDTIETVLDGLLGKPKQKSGVQWNYGSNKGSLFVTVQGDKKGYWKDFQTDEGGRSLVSLIQRETGLPFKETLSYAASLVGLTKADTVTTYPVKPKAVSNPTQELTPYQKTMIKVARSIVRGAQSAKGTLAETYLHHRGYWGEVPTSLRFHSGVYVKKYDRTFPAMVLPIPNEKGNVQGVHLTLLDPKTGQKAKVKVEKLRFGPLPDTIGLGLNLDTPKGAISLVGEGIETSLSLKTAFPQCDVKVALSKGGFKRIDPQALQNDVVLCIDNDLENWREDIAIMNSVERLETAGKRVWLAMPDSLNGQKTDYNDVLNHCGKEAIINHIQSALRITKDSFNEVGKSIHPQTNPTQLKDYFQSVDAHLASIIKDAPDLNIFGAVFEKSQPQDAIQHVAEKGAMSQTRTFEPQTLASTQPKTQDERTAKEL